MKRVTVRLRHCKVDAEIVFSVRPLASDHMLAVWKMITDKMAQMGHDLTKWNIDSIEAEG